MSNKGDNPILGIILAGAIFVAYPWIKGHFKKDWVPLYDENGSSMSYDALSVKKDNAFADVKVRAVHSASTKFNIERERIGSLQIKESTYTIRFDCTGSHFSIFDSQNIFSDGTKAPGENPLSGDMTPSSDQGMVKMKAFACQHRSQWGNLLYMWKLLFN